MTAQKRSEAASALSPATAQPRSGARKPWVKKTPVQTVLDQIEKMRQQVAEKEEALKRERRELQKLEEARKILEAT